MPSSILEAFIRLFADDTALRKSFADLPATALRAGSEVGARFSEGTRQGFAAAVTPGRATQARQLILPTVGGREVDLSSPFTKGAQQFRMEQDVARAIQSGAGTQGLGLEIPGTLGKFREAMRGLPGENDRAAASFKGMREAARIFGSTIAAEVSPAFGELVAATAHGARSMGALGAGIGATLAVVALYASHLKDATEFQVKLNLAAKSFDPAAAGALLQEAIAGLEKFQQLKREAAEGRGAIGGPPPFRAFFANLQLLFGAGVDELTKRARDAQAQMAASFAEVTAPKQALQGEIDRLKLLAQGIDMERQAAESADALRASVDKLVAARQEQADAEAALISRERLGIIKEFAAALEAVGDDSKAAAEAEAVAKGKWAEVDRRALQARKQGAQDIAQLQRDGIRDAGALAAAEINATEKIRATVSRRRDVIVDTLKAYLEAQTETSGSLEAIFQARRQLEETATRATLENLAQETAARKAAAAETFADQPIALQRELTQITEEETTKRTEILAKSVQNSIQLAQRERQERIAKAEQLFSIARILNQRRLQDDLDTQSAIAKAAQAGSQVQIAALQKVAEIQAQLQTQGRAAITQGIAILQQQSQRIGLEGPAFISLRSIQEGVDRQRKRDEEIRRQLEAGGSVRTEEAQAALQNQPFFDQFKQFGDAMGSAFRSAVTPLRDAFTEEIGPALTDQLGQLTAQASDAFAGLVTGAIPALANLEKLFGDTWDRIVAKTQDGTSRLVSSITRMVEETIARGLADAERRS